MCSYLDTIKNKHDMTVTIKKAVLSRIGSRNHMRLRTRIALALGVADATVRRWIAEGSDDLTKAASLKIISEELKIPIDQITTETKDQEPKKTKA